MSRVLVRVATSSRRRGLVPRGLGHDAAPPQAYALLASWARRAGLLDASTSEIDRVLTEGLAATPQGGPGSASIHGSLGSAVWICAHLARQRMTRVDPRVLAKAYAAHARELVREPCEMDLVGGLSGVAVAVGALGRAPRRSLLAAIAARIVAASRKTRGRRAWVVDLGARGKPVVDLGLAHGQPGVLAVMALCQAEVPSVALEAALREGAAELVSHRLSRERGGGFSTRSDRGSRAINGWCYGDAGVALALYRAARALESTPLTRSALALARRAARRSREDSGLVAPCLCHGSAGLAHILARFHAVTGERLFADAARRWYRITLDHLESGALFFHTRFDGRRVRDEGFLTGAVGVAMALLAATTPLAPTWDRLLLADLA